MTNPPTSGPDGALMESPSSIDVTGCAYHEMSANTPTAAISSRSDDAFLRAWRALMDGVAGLKRSASDRTLDELDVLLYRSMQLRKPER